MNGAPAVLTRRPQKSELMRSESFQSGPCSRITTFLPALGEDRGKHRARGACADDDDIDLFERSHPHHLCFGAMCGMYGMPRAA